MGRSNSFQTHLSESEQISADIHLEEFYQSCEDHGDDDSVRFSDEEIEDLSDYNLNGRQIGLTSSLHESKSCLPMLQIKNTMSIAQTIAVEGDKSLSAEQVQLIIKLFQSSAKG